MKVPMGKVYFTQGVSDAIESGAGEELLTHITCHANGDWGDLDEEDKATNDRALVDGGRLLSSYTLGGEPIYIITEWDRSSTTILLKNEY